jgi:hypothetical protein
MPWMRRLTWPLLALILLSLFPSAAAGPNTITVEDCGSTSIPTQMVGNILRHMFGDTPEDKCGWLYEQVPTVEDLFRRNVVAEQSLIQDPTGTSPCVGNIAQELGSGITAPAFCLRDAVCDLWTGCPTVDVLQMPLSELPAPVGPSWGEASRVLHCVYAINGLGFPTAEFYLIRCLCPTWTGPAAELPMCIVNRWS